jgi:hypothetical protein
MTHAGPVLDRALIFDTYACRTGKGALAVVLRAQQHSRRYPWYAKIDIRSYFPSIDHQCLLRLLARKFRDRRMLGLMQGIIDAHCDSPGRGLPIGALTSQHFANFYLASLDRLLLERCRVSGIVRYMDDLVWWGHSREQVKTALQQAIRHAEQELLLTVKTPVQVGRSAQGMTFCGYRILPGALRLSRRRKRCYGRGRRRWEAAYAGGAIDAAHLQAGYAAVVGMARHADATVWRREQLRRQPLAEPLAEL